MWRVILNKTVFYNFELCPKRARVFLFFLAIVPNFRATCSNRRPVLGSIVCAGPLNRSFRKTKGAFVGFFFRIG